jgi:hypothetical protein
MDEVQELVKICRECKEKKHTTEYPTKKGGKFGVCTKCKDCVKKSSQIYYNSNKNKINQRNRSYRQTNAEKISADLQRKRQEDPAKYRAYSTKWSSTNRDAKKQSSKRWRDNNRDKKLADTRRRQANKLKATPKWAQTEFEKFVILEMYALSILRTKALKIKHNVDHIVPLRSALVCGLHCVANLQIVPAKTNQTKGNRYWPDMPEKD